MGVEENDELLEKCFRVLKRRGQSWDNSTLNLTMAEVELPLLVWKFIRHKNQTLVFLLIQYHSFFHTW